MSWVPPNVYARRFYEFMKNVVFPEEKKQNEEESENEDSKVN